MESISSIMEETKHQIQTMEPAAWQPLTFRGVARFSRASFRRLGLVFLVASGLWGIVLAWFISRAYLPVIDQAVSNLPDQVELQNGRLLFGGDSGLVLGRNAHLAIVIGWDEPASAGQLADVQWELRPREFWISSLFGYLKLPYPAGWRFPLDRLNAEPWWGARRPYLVAGIILGTAGGLPLVWFGLAAWLALPLWFWTWLLHRQATLTGCWRLAGAALIPGSVWLGAVVIAYAVHFLSLVGLVVFFALHLAVDFLYLLMAPMGLPLRDSPGASRENPFTPMTTAAKSESKPFRP